MTARYFAMVRWPDLRAWERLGWLCTGPLPGRHGEWSCGVEWRCECKVARPVTNGGNT